MPVGGDSLLSCGFLSSKFGRDGRLPLCPLSNCVCPSSFVRGLFLLALLGTTLAISTSLEFLSPWWLVSQKQRRTGIRGPSPNLPQIAKLRGRGREGLAQGPGDSRQMQDLNCGLLTLGLVLFPSPSPASKKQSLPVMLCLLKRE